MKYIFNNSPQGLRTRPFTTSSLILKHPSVLNFLYWEGLDWDRIFTHFAVIDPVDPKGVLYLTEREYLSLQKVALSTETSILVIARPGDEPPADWSEKKIKDLSKISPNSPAAFMQPKYWRSALLPYMISKNDSTLVRVDQGNLKRLVRHYCVSLASYAGVSLGQTYLNSVQHFITYSENHIRCQGINSYIKRLSVTKFCLECYLGGSRADTWALGHPMKLNRAGIPVWLPVPVRQWFIARNKPYIRVWFSLLNIYRALEGVYNDPDFSTITAPPVEDSSTAHAFRQYCKQFIREHNMRRGPGILLPDHFPLILTGSGVGPGPSIFQAPRAARLWGYQRVNHLLKWMEYTGDHHGRDMYNFLYYLSRPFSERWRRGYLNKEFFLGALSLKYEPAGKVRVFAMVDYWTQHVLAPMHTAIFQLLKVFEECDATFDQEGSVNSMMSLNCDSYHSYDLKSATDMIAVSYYKDMFDNIFGKPCGQLWTSLLVDRDFALPFREGKQKERYLHEGKHHIRYTRGQPMGALSSWGSLALFHHLLVQYSWYSLTKSLQPFRQYRVLGDDVVIGHTGVAEQYIIICGKLSIPISLAKSVISPVTTQKGKLGERLFQFANQIVLGPENVSPASLREEVSANTPSTRLELITRLNERGWRRPFINEISFYLRGLVPRKWAQSRFTMSNGKMPLFMIALLPVLLSPAVRYRGITGISKYLAWSAVLQQTCSYADLLNHKLWNLSRNTLQTQGHVKFLSTRAAETYVSLLSSQILIKWDKEYHAAKKFGAESLSSMIHWYLPRLDGYLQRNVYSKSGKLHTCPYWGADEEWFADPKVPLNPEGKLMSAWRDLFREARKPLYSYEEWNPQKAKNETKEIHIDYLNVPLVCAAREQYLERLGKELRPLLSYSRLAKTSWILDLKISSDMAVLNQLGPDRIQKAWMIDSRCLTWKEKETTNHFPNLDVPLFLPLFKGQVFALSTQDEFYTYGKVTSRDPYWDMKEALVPEPSTPWTLPATYERLFKIESILNIASQLQPERMLVREYLTDEQKKSKYRSDKFNRTILKHVKAFYKHLGPEFTRLLQIKGGIFPGLPGV